LKNSFLEETMKRFEEQASFSLVFRGHSSGKAVVVQGTDMGGGSTNISVRLEDV